MGQSPTAIRSLSDLTLFRRDFSRSPVGNRMGQVSFPKWGKHFIRENRQFGGAVPPPTVRVRVPPPREQGPIRWIFRSSVGLGGPLLKRAAVPSPHGTGRWDRCFTSGVEADSRPTIRRIGRPSRASNRSRAGPNPVDIPF